MRSYIEWLDTDGFWIRDAWIETAGRTGGPGHLNLFPRQRRIMEFALTPNEETGKFPYETVLYSDIKKTGKSVAAASVGAWYAECASAGTEIFIIANSQEQGAGRVFRDMLFHFQKRQEKYGKKYCKLGEYRIDFPNGTFIQVLSNSFRAAAGSRHALTIWDELWGCLSPETKILKDDLTWVPAGELKIGDGLISFDETRSDGQKYRNWKHGKVVNTGRKILPVRKIKLVNGKEFVATINHPWIARTKNHHNNEWITTEELKPGCKLMKVLDVWENRCDYDAGYIAGALDGEGSLSIMKNGDHRLTFTQRKNIMWEEMERLYDESGVDSYDTGKHLTIAYKSESGVIIGKSAADRIITRKSQIMKILGSCRPKRLLEKFDIDKMGRMTAIDYVEVESISEEFEAEVVTLETSSRTYISDGYCSHNSVSEIDRRLWDEMVPIPTVPFSLRFISSYAGYENESELLWELYLRGIGPGEGSEYESKGMGKKIPELEDLPCWENGDLFTYWSHESDLPWYTQEFLDKRQQEERPAAFIRLFTNNWVTSHEAFIPIEWWDRAAEAYEATADIWEAHPMRYFPITIGIDAGILRDSTAMVGVAYDSKRGKVGIVFHKIWKPSPRDPIDIEVTLENELRKLYNEHKFVISSIVYDPKHLLPTMMKLQKEGFPTRVFDQTTSNMIAASQLLYELMKSKNLEAYPDDDIRRHIQMSVAEQTARGFRIVKTKVSKRHHIDAAIALAMASYDAVVNGGVDTSIPVIIESPFSDMTMHNISKETVIPFPLQGDND